MSITLYTEVGLLAQKRWKLDHLIEKLNEKVLCYGKRDIDISFPITILAIVASPLLFIVFHLTLLQAIFAFFGTIVLSTWFAMSLVRYHRLRSYVQEIEELRKLEKEIWPNKEK
jgi:hypothetical protein